MENYIFVSEIVILISILIDLSKTDQFSSLSTSNEEWNEVRRFLRCRARDLSLIVLVVRYHCSLGCVRLRRETVEEREIV